MEAFVILIFFFDLLVAYYAWEKYHKLGTIGPVHVQNNIDYDRAAGKSLLFGGSRLTLLLLFIPSVALSECLEYKIIDKGNSVEAVCVGKPPTETEKKERDRDRSIQDREANKLEKEEEIKRQRQSPPEDFDKCYHETFGKMTFKGAQGVLYADALAKELCRMSVERKDCVMKMLKGRTGNLMGFNTLYQNALGACN